MKLIEKAYEYDAFISYRHIPRDMHIAEKLHKALEAYRTPSYLVQRGVPARLKKVFRDREELPTSSNLGQDIEDALKASKHLIVICSPEAVQSKWVLREVEFFGEYHGYDKILTLLLDGEPKDAFPPSLIRHQYDDQGTLLKVIEPLAADIRATTGVSSLKLLKTEKLRLIAGILGCKFDELRQREHERKVRRIVSLSVSAAAFLLAVTAFTLWQLNEVNMAREKAVYNEKLAQEERNKALSTQSSMYASLAKKAADSGDYLLGISMAIDALPKDLQNPEKPLIQDAKDALYYTAAQYGMQERSYLYPPAATTNEIAQWCFFKENSEDVVTVGDRVIREFSPTTGRLSNEWMAADGYEILAISPGADRVVIARYQSGKGLDLQFWDILQGRMVTQQTLSLGDDEESIQYHLDFKSFDGLVKASFEPEGKRFFVACNEYFKDDVGCRSKIYLFDSDSGELLDRSQLTFGDAFGDILLNNGQIAVGISMPDGNGQSINVYEIQNKALRYRTNVDDNTFIDTINQYRALGITSDGKKLSYVTLVAGGSILHIIDMDTGGHQEIHTDRCVISNDGNMAAFFWVDESTFSKQFVVQDLVHDKPIVVLENTPSFDIPEIQSFFFCSNDRYILFNDSEMLDIQNTVLYTLDLKNRMYADSDISGKYLAYLDQYGTGAVFQLKDPLVDETVVPSENKAAVRDNGVLLFEDKFGGGTVVRKWEAAQKTISVTDYEESDVASLCDIDGGAIGFMGSNTNLDVFSMDTGRAMSALKIDGQFHDFQADPSGKYVLVSKHGINTDDGVFLLDAQSGRQIRQLSTSDLNGCQTSSMRRVGFFPGGKYCWSAEYHEPETEYTGIVIFEVETGKPVSCIHMRENFSDFSASVSSDGSRMVVQPLHTMQLWTIDYQMNPAYLCDLQGDFLCMDDSVVVTNDRAGYTNTLYIYDIKTGQQKATIRLPDAQGYKGILIDGGKYLLTVTESSTKLGPIRLMLWDCNTGNAVATLYSDYSNGTVMLGIGLVNGGKEFAIVSEYYGKTYIRAIPFVNSFDQVYETAVEKLSGRRFDVEQDMDHIQ